MRRKDYRRLREALVSSCRSLMVQGVFQPSMELVTRAAGCSIRSGFAHYKRVASLHVAAIEDWDTRLAILYLIDPALAKLPDEVQAKLVTALVLGWSDGDNRVRTPKEGPHVET